MIFFMIKAILSFFVAALIIGAVLGAIYLMGMVIALPFMLIGELLKAIPSPFKKGVSPFKKGVGGSIAEWERDRAVHNAKRLAAKDKAKAEARAVREEARLLKAGARMAVKDAKLLKVQLKEKQNGN
jgi:hypothetical protein